MELLAKTMSVTLGDQQASLIVVFGTKYHQKTLLKVRHGLQLRPRSIHASSNDFQGEYTLPAWSQRTVWNFGDQTRRAYQQGAGRIVPLLSQVWSQVQGRREVQEENECPGFQGLFRINVY